MKYRKSFLFLLLLLILPFSARAAEPAPGLNTGSWQLYFGQLHAHTDHSDGIGTVEEAFAQAAAVEGLDFFAVTDHSDSFDNDTQGSLTGDGNGVSGEWAAGQAAAKAATNENFVGLYGFEMSWNQGQGHISTFNTSGWLSRDQKGYSLYKDGLENYYQALLTAPDSISQFNHPGTQYGDFKNFAWYSAEVDALVNLIEVGSGTGGKYRRYEEAYGRALDQGWHLAPTNNQNNHNGSFGSSDSHRTVILAGELTEAGIYDALRNYRVYATEDSDLQLYYTLNGHVMGSRLTAAETGDAACLILNMWDPTDASWGSVEVITEGGAVAATAQASAELSFTLPADRAYYYLRITQADGDVAITAPVWLQQKDNYGISVLETETALTRAGETQNIRLTVTNGEAKPLNITAVALKDLQGNLLGSAVGDSVAQFDTKTFTFPVCFEADGVYTLTAEVTATFEGTPVTLTESLEITVLPLVITGDVLVDGTRGDVGFAEFTALATARNISIHVERQSITAEQLEKCQLLVIPAPKTAMDSETVELIKSYVNQDGNLLLLGSAESKDACNALLHAIGATMTLAGEDSGDPMLAVNISETSWTEGITEGQIYAHNGCSIYLGAGQALATDEAGNVLLAAEKSILLAGGNFLADEWINPFDDPNAIAYANRTIAENLLGVTRTAPQVTSIVHVRSGVVGRIYLVEGIVTAGTHNSNTTFPDTIYLQDATGGIAVVGYGEKGLELGRRVRIIGALEASGDQLRMHSIEILEKTDPISPETASSLDYATSGGKLLALEGRVISVDLEADAVTLRPVRS